MFHWLRNRQRLGNARLRRGDFVKRPSFRPTLEGLEDRCLLSGNVLQGSLMENATPNVNPQVVHAANAAVPYSAGASVDNDKDFLSTYTGPQNADLTPVSAQVTVNNASQQLQFSAVLAGNIGTTPGSGSLSSPTPLYVFGLNRGAGTQRFLSGSPSIGAGVYFDSVVVLNPNGTSEFIDFTNNKTTILPAGDIQFNGNQITASFPLSDFPSTGFAPNQYTWNFWPRYGLGANNQVADFLPDANNGGTGGYNAPVQVIPAQNGPPPSRPPVYINPLDSYDTTIADSFPTAIDNLNVNQFFSAAQVPTGQLQQAFTTLAELTAPQNFQGLTQLVEAEVGLAFDTLLTLSAELGGMGSSINRTSDMHSLQQSIQQNPLEGTETGSLLGALSFDLSLRLAVSSASGGMGASGY